MEVLWADDVAISMTAQYKELKRHILLLIGLGKPLIEGFIGLGKPLIRIYSDMNNQVFQYGRKTYWNRLTTKSTRLLGTAYIRPGTSNIQG